MPEILYQPGAMPQIVRVFCPTTSGEYANVTWWRGSERIAVGEELLFRPLGSHHLGKYHCEARSAAGLSTSRELEVNRVFVQNVIPTTQRIFLMEGQAASIPCTAPDGYPAPVVFWNFSRSDVSMQMITDPEGTLHLPYIATRDHGLILKCSAKQLTGVYTIKTAELVVYPRPQECFEDPRLLYATHNVILKQNSDALIYCVPSGSSSSISWTVHLNGPKAPFSEDAQFLLRIKPSILTVNERTFQVTCNDTSNGLESVSTVTLASEPSILPMTNVSKLEGEELFLKCNASGKPEPSIVWYFNNAPVDKRHVVENSIRRPNVTCRDMGVYRCEAFNSFGRTYQEVIVSVNRAKPHILVDTDCYEVVVGDRLLIPCVALAFREPIRTWFRNGSVINATLDDESLELIDIQLEDSGRYACKVCEKQNAEFPCPLYEFEVKVFLSQLIETPKKPIVVRGNEALNISCIPRFADDVILWRIDEVFMGRGRTLYLEEPRAGTYSCELRRNETLVTRWDGSVTVRKLKDKFRITEISCRSDGVAFLKWTPVEHVAFYEILHYHESQGWQPVKFITSETTSTVDLGRCAPCQFKVRSHEEAGSVTSEIRQCHPAPLSGREDIRRLVKDITVSREANCVYIRWTSLVRKKMCFRVCAHNGTICQVTYETGTSFSLRRVSLQSPFTVSSCDAPETRSAQKSFSLTTYYNCNLTLETTEIRHMLLNSVEISWNFSSDSFCSLAGRLVFDNSSAYRVDLVKKRFRLMNLEHHRRYCFKLEASHDDRILQGTSAHESCFYSGQGWEVLGLGPLVELQDGGRRISVRNGTRLFYSKNDRFEPLPYSNLSTVDVKPLGKTSIKFVQKLDGHCKVSNIMFPEEDRNSDWYLWLCGLVIIVGGVAITAAVLFRKMSYIYRATEVSV